MFAADPRDVAALNRSLIEAGPENDHRLDPCAKAAGEKLLRHGGSGPANAPHKTIVLISIIRGFRPSDREDAAFDGDVSAEVLGLEQEDSRRADEDVVEVSAPGVDVVHHFPALADQLAKCLGGHPLAVSALPPALDSCRR